MKCVHIMKFAKVFAENKVRFARAEQLWLEGQDDQLGTSDMGKWV